MGTGTLQEATGCLELFQEDVDELRSSTEELYFMEKTKGQTECEKPSLPAQVIFETILFDLFENMKVLMSSQYAQMTLPMNIFFI